MSKENPNEFKIINKNERLHYRQIINQFKQQLAEKDKEIEKKMMSFEKRCQEYYKSDEFKRDFAIQELEKVRDYAWFNYEKFRNYLDQQIKELKGQDND